MICNNKILPGVYKDIFSKDLIIMTKGLFGTYEGIDFEVTIEGDCNGIMTPTNSGSPVTFTFDPYTCKILWGGSGTEFVKEICNS